MNILIIGSGLAGCYIANRLSQNQEHNVHLLEIGGDDVVAPNDIVFKARSFGIRFGHTWNVGGTTSVWHGGMIPLSERETLSPNEDNSIRYETLTRLYRKISKIMGLNSWLNKLNDSNIEKKLNGEISLINIAIPFKPKKSVPNNLINLYKNVKDLNFEIINKNVKICRFKSLDISHSLEVDTIICCAGGLGSPLIIKKMLDFIGYENRNIGKNLTDHPMGFLGKIKVSRFFIKNFLNKKSKIDGYHIRVGFSIYDNDENLSHCIYLRPTLNLKNDSDIIDLKKKLSLYRAEKNWFKFIFYLFNIDIIFEILYTKFNILIPTRYYSLLIVSEQKCINENYIESIDNKRHITWDISPLEINSIRNSLNKFLIFFDKYIFEKSIASDIQNRLWSAAHYSGTCRISDSENFGVVDTNLKVYGLNNVYVCDGSVIPKTGYSNTGMTIIALSEYLSERLINE